MSLTMRRMMPLACLLVSSVVWPSLSWALGLGEIHLNSALNEPLNAEIDLVAATPDELTGLHAVLASREAFVHYGIDKPPFLSSLTFKVGKGKDGRDALLVRSTDAIPEPFVTFLVEATWARGRLMREYTVLLDPPVYTPGETANSAAPVAAPATAAPPVAAPPRAAAPPAVQTSPPPTRAAAAPVDSIRVGRGDTLSKIAHSLEAAPIGSAGVDQTMIALYRANPGAFGGNINVLREGAVLRVPGADQIAALNQREAVGEVRRQMESWRAGAAPSTTGHLKLVTPGAGGATGGGADAQALKERVKDLEGQLAESKRLIDIRNNELAALQRKLAAPSAPAKAAVQTSPPPPVQTPPPAPISAAPTTAPPATAPPPTVTPTVKPKPKPKATAAATPADTGSWMDWVAAHWWVPVSVLVLVLTGLMFAAIRRRRLQGEDTDRYMDETDIADPRPTAGKLAAARKGADSFVVEESGQHAVPDLGGDVDRFSDTADLTSPEDTMSSESAVSLDQGDPMAEADFHMAYGLYDQAADLVRIALEREPERRDLRLKLLEIYFVWGNKDLFLQTAKGLEATRDRAPTGEWDKIVIMGKQICPDDPLFAGASGGSGSAGDLVDLNLEGGENRVDIDLFGDPEGERSESPPLHSADHLDFTLDTPERGADDSPTRQMPPRDEPTVESELMSFDDDKLLSAPFFATPAETPTAEVPALPENDLHDRIAARLPSAADQTAEVSIDDLGLDLDQLEETGTLSNSASRYDEPPHSADAPTMVAGLDERSRQMMADAARMSNDDTTPERTLNERDLTELERELEASFVAELESSHDDDKTAIFIPDPAPTEFLSNELDGSPTTRFKSNEFENFQDLDKIDMESTSKLRGINANSIDLDLDQLAAALGQGDTLEQPRAAEDVFSNEVFEMAGMTGRDKVVDLDVGDAMLGNESPTNKLQAQTNKLKPIDLGGPEMEPVTMSEVGTKLDLARAYMDMGDPEGARSILEEVVQEGSASQKQEASRLIESLPG